MTNKEPLVFYVEDYHNLRIIECFDSRISDEKYNYIMAKHKRDLEVAELIKKVFKKKTTPKELKELKEWINNDK